MVLTLPEAAARLGITREKLRLKIIAGELPAFKTGSGKTSRWRIKPEDLDAFIEANSAKAS
jgi:excisionase family DNA binding protein